MNVKIREYIYHNIITQLDYKYYELLGIIGSSGQNIIDSFVLDEKASTSKYHCKPDPGIIHVFDKDNIFFVGIIHSHPPGLHNLSNKDIEYAYSIIRSAQNLPFILMGIVCDRELYLYQVSLEKTVYLNLIIVGC